MATFPPEPLYISRCGGCGTWVFGTLCAHCEPLYQATEQAA